MYISLYICIHFMFLLVCWHAWHTRLHTYKSPRELASPHDTFAAQGVDNKIIDVILINKKRCVLVSKDTYFFFNQNTCILTQHEYTCSCSSRTRTFLTNKNTCALQQRPPAYYEWNIAGRLHNTICVYVCTTAHDL